MTALLPRKNLPPRSSGWNLFQFEKRLGFHTRFLSIPIFILVLTIFAILFLASIKLPLILALLDADSAQLAEMFQKSSNFEAPMAQSGRYGSLLVFLLLMINYLFLRMRWENGPQQISSSQREDRPLLTALRLRYFFYFFTDIHKVVFNILLMGVIAALFALPAAIPGLLIAMFGGCREEVEGVIILMMPLATLIFSYNFLKLFLRRGWFLFFRIWSERKNHWILALSEPQWYKGWPELYFQQSFYALFLCVSPVCFGSLAVFLSCSGWDFMGRMGRIGLYGTILIFTIPWGLYLQYCFYSNFEDYLHSYQSRRAELSENSSPKAIGQSCDWEA